MIIDKILDRKDGQPYSPEAFYRDVMGYGEIGHGIAGAMDGGSEEDVRRELCAYIDEGGYRPDIKTYINSVNWLSDNITLGGFGDFSEDPQGKKDLQEAAKRHGVEFYPTYYDHELKGSAKAIEALTVDLWGMGRGEWAENALYEGVAD